MPWFPTLDLNLFKIWNFTRLENGPYFKLEMYSSNILNHTNPSGPASLTITDPQFGLFRAAGGTRSIYFRARIGF
jgi:hypothetical protein